MRSLLLTLLIAPLTATAQEFDAHGFSVAPLDGDLRDSLSVERPGFMTAKDFYVGGVFEYAKAPLVQVFEVADTTRTTTIVDNLVALNLSAGFTAHERVRLDVRMPVYFASFGPDGYQGVDTGVLRLSSMILAVVPGEDGGLGFGFVPWIDLPTGTESLLNTAKVAGGGKLALTHEGEALTINANLGVQFNPDAQLGNIGGDDMLVAGLGATYLVKETVAVGAEAVLRTPWVKNEAPGTNAPAELIVSARGRQPTGFNWIGGAGLGLTSGASAAKFRLFFGLGFGKITDRYIAPLDTDGDGIVDPDDQCVTEPETVNAYLDEDGCPDSTDSSLAVHVKWQGEPLGGSTLVLTGPDGDETFETAESTTRKDVVPGPSDWTAKATKGVCLAGEGAVAVEVAQEAELVVELQRVIMGKADITVMNSKGEPLPDATIRWMTDTPECVPQQEQVDAQGKLIQELGGGTHTIVVEAPGFASHVQEVEVGEVDIVLSTKLKSTKIRVEEKKIVILEKVFFETNKDVIKSQSYELLDQVATTIRTNPQIGNLLVVGHTDSQGRKSYNMDLSQRRAAAVRQYLIDKGVKAERLEAKGMGPEVPIDDNGTAAGRANNRRVEFEILGVPKAPEPETPSEVAPEGAAPEDAAPAE